MLFDHLQPLHHLPPQARVQLEQARSFTTSAIVTHRGTTNTANIHPQRRHPGLDGRDRNIVAAVVRYQSQKSLQQ